MTKFKIHRVIEHLAGILTQSGTKRQNLLVDMRKQEILQLVAQDDKIQNPSGDRISCRDSYAKWHKMTKSSSRYEKAGNSIVSSKK